MDYELTLFDRLNVIRDVNKKYDLEHNAYLSFSGGKDSTILHYLLDMALPDNHIPRVFINTGIEYNDIVAFVKELASKDDRFILLKPTQAVKPMLEKYGYPFKSKQHSHNLMIYQRNKDKFEEVRKVIEANPNLLKDYNFIHELPLGIKTLVKYRYGVRERESCMSIMTIPKLLQYQMTPQFNIKLSDMCCLKMKKEPIHKWELENNRFVAITGMRKEEGGNRKNISGCILTDKNGKLTKFHPLLVVDDEWEDTFIKTQKIHICKLYEPPYNFRRTGCKYCPFSLDLQEQLDVGRKLMPNEVKQAEMLWKPVFDEYRRLDYRLRKQMSIFDYMEETK